MLMQYWFPFRGCSPFWLYSWLENWDSWTLVGLNAMFKRRIKKKKNSFLFGFVFLRMEIRKEGKSFAFLLLFWFCSSRFCKDFFFYERLLSFFFFFLPSLQSFDKYVFIGTCSNPNAESKLKKMLCRITLKFD